MLVPFIATRGPERESTTTLWPMVVGVRQPGTESGMFWTRNEPDEQRETAVPRLGGRRSCVHIFMVSWPD